MNNIYTENPLKVLIVNPYNSSIIKNISIPNTSSKIRGGVRDTDFSILDKNVSELVKDETPQITDTIIGHPESVMIYPQTTIVDLRFKIFIATGIHPYRQYIVLYDNYGTISLPYSVYSGHDIIETNIFNSLQNNTEQQILNVPFDLHMVNAKQDIIIEMNDNFITLARGKKHINRVIVCDLYSILDPSNENLREILNTSAYQKDLLYYGFIMKFFPILPLDEFEQLYMNQSSTTHPFLSPVYNKLQNTLREEMELINKLYDIIPNALKYIKKISQRYPYAIVNIEAQVKIPSINIRNLFDLFELDEVYVFALVKLIINGRTYVASKKHVLYVESIDVNTEHMQIDSLIIITNDNITITIYKDSISVRTKYNENDGVDFDMSSKSIIGIIKQIINRINKLGLVVITEGDIIDKRVISFNVSNSNIIIYWPESMSTEQFLKFGDFLNKLENINFLTVLQSSTVGIYNCTFHAGSQQLNPTKRKNLLYMYPQIKNQYDYYTNSDFRTKWNSLTKKNITFTQRSSNTVINVNGFDNISFEYTYGLLIALMFMFSKQLRAERKIIDVEDTNTKVLRKLKGTDPELFNLKRHDPTYKVYSIKCQSARQPTIYKQHELSYLNRAIKNKLVKFWNFTEERSVYYHCPNKRYPHLSFRPQDHPLGYCLPCCKKLTPSKLSRQNKIDLACHSEHILPHKSIDKIIKKLDMESTHLLTYGKSIPTGRISKIPPPMENNLILSKTKYHLVGVSQELPLFDNAGLVYSIAYVLGISLEEYAKNITKIINNNTLSLLDGGHTLMFNSADQLRETIINMLVDTNRVTFGVDTSILNWINIFAELTYMRYGIHLIIVTDYDNNLKLRITNTTQVCLLSPDCDTSCMVIVAHDSGIYPVIEKEQKIFSMDDKLIKSFTEMVETVRGKIKNTGITILDIIDFINKYKDYDIEYLLRGKRGLIYAAVLTRGNNTIYWPCIYSEYLDNRYKTSIKFPNFKSFKRKALYDCVDDFNAFITKRERKRGNKNIEFVDPFAVIKHKDSYIGFKSKFINNSFGTTFYHAPEKAAGRYHLNIIDIPYNIVDINDAISKQSHHTVHPKVGQYAYNNYVYNLFLTEFSYELRRHKNTKIRERLKNVLNTSGHVDRRKIKETLKDYESDYKVFIKLLSLNHHSKVLNMMDYTMFNFDMLPLLKLKNMDIEQRKKNIASIMKPYIRLTKNTPDISNIIASCQTDAKLEHCSNNKLLINEVNLYKCIDLLSKDIGIPYLYETITLHISSTISELQFIKRVTEVLNIQEIYC